MTLDLTAQTPVRIGTFTYNGTRWHERRDLFGQLYYESQELTVPYVDYGRDADVWWQVIEREDGRWDAHRNCDSNSIGTSTHRWPFESLDEALQYVSAYGTDGGLDA